ncbi:MAG: acetylornithine deacetylase [Lysobacterales bacterium]|jgi:acetylornithine deacetylase
MSTDACLRHLEALVACDTQNPPRTIDGDSRVFAYCRDVVGSGFEVRTWDHGDGHVTWYAVRGKPSVLFNVHLDTVPTGDGWSTDPHRLALKEGRAYGRGSCDIKGAAAVLLTLAEQGAKNLALLFTTDEEGEGGCCVDSFLADGLAEGYRQVVVAEPTACQSVLAHRGYLSVKGWFEGTPGHSSEARALDDNAIHALALWSGAALEVARKRKKSPEDPGSCFNIGRIEGGTKSNVIAGRSFVHWSARLGPGQSNRAFLRELEACTPAGARARWEVPFAGKPLPACGRKTDRAERFAREHGLDIGRPVDFWTEASIFSAAGLPAMVLGPGNIAQAHQTDEWVAVEQLERAMEIYRTVVEYDV